MSTRWRPKYECICEVDDYPGGSEYVFDCLDELKGLNDTFKVTLFAVPSQMMDNTGAWGEVEKRSEWVRVGIHGFNHEKGECYKWERGYTDKLADIMANGAWCSAYKAPQYGYGADFINGLREWGLTVCVREYADLVGLDRTYQPWYKVEPVNLGIRVARLTSPTHRFYHAHIGGHGVNDIRRLMRQYRRRIDQYNFVWTEDVAQWV